MIEEYGLANIMRTGYADGGMSAREEKVRNRLKENKSRLKKLEAEWGALDEILTPSPFAGEIVKNAMRDLYDFMIRLTERDIRDDELWLELWRF